MRLSDTLVVCVCVFFLKIDRVELDPKLTRTQGRPKPNPIIHSNHPGPFGSGWVGWVDRVYSGSKITSLMKDNFSLIEGHKYQIHFEFKRQTPKI